MSGKNSSENVISWNDIKLCIKCFFRLSKMIHRIDTRKKNKNSVKTVFASNYCMMVKMKLIHANKPKTQQFTYSILWNSSSCQQCDVWTYSIMQMLRDLLFIWHWSDQFIRCLIFSAVFFRWSFSIGAQTQALPVQKFPVYAAFLCFSSFSQNETEKNITYVLCNWLDFGQSEQKKDMERRNMHGGLIWSHKAKDKKRVWHCQ